MKGIHIEKEKKTIFRKKESYEMACGKSNTGNRFKDNILDFTLGDGKENVKNKVELFEKKVKENLDAKTNQSPTVKFQRKNKLDVLICIDSPKIKKTASPLKRNILISKRMSNMTNECLTVSKEKFAAF